MDARQNLNGILRWVCSMVKAILQKHSTNSEYCLFSKSYGAAETNRTSDLL